MRSSFTASCTSTQARASESTARTPTRQAGVRTQAGSSSPIITTNDIEEEDNGPLPRTIPYGLLATYAVDWKVDVRDGRNNPAYRPRSLREQLTNERQQAGERHQFHGQPQVGRVWLPGKDRKVVQQRRAKSRATVGLLWELRRPRLLNDGGRGPCGRSDQAVKL